MAGILLDRYHMVGLPKEKNMDCKTAQSLVIPYINDQLSDEETEDFLEHIENCKECYEELEIHFTVHYALQKLDEDDKISFNIPKMLKENLRDTKNRIHRRKIFHGVTACVVALADDSASSDGYDPAGNVPERRVLGRPDCISFSIRDPGKRRKHRWKQRPQRRQRQKL